MSTELPSWLDPVPITSTEPAPPVPPVPTTKTSSGITPYRELQFENLFETALDRLSLGHQLIDICDDDPRQLPAAEFMRWIKKDKERYARYKESQEIAAEFLVYSALKAANGNDSMNDVNRDKLIAETSLKIAGAWSPKRYGKEQGMLTPNTGSGGIVINIGQVESPYALDAAGGDTDRTNSGLITDVEAK